MNSYLYSWYKQNTSFCFAGQNIFIWSRPDIKISKINQPMTSSRFTAWLSRMLFFFISAVLLFVSAARVMPPKSKRKLQLEGFQATRAAKLSRESRQGTFCAVRIDDVGDISLSQLIAMHGDTLDTMKL